MLCFDVRVGLVERTGRIGDWFFLGQQISRDLNTVGVSIFEFRSLDGLILGDVGVTNIEIGDNALHGGKVTKKMLSDEFQG